MRLWIPHIGGAPKKLRCARKVLRKQPALHVKQGEIIRGGGVSQLGGSREQPFALLGSRVADATTEVKHGKRKHCFAIAPICRKTVPVGSLCVVSRNAVTAGIELA